MSEARRRRAGDAWEEPDGAGGRYQRISLHWERKAVSENDGGGGVGCAGDVETMVKML